MSDVSSLYPQPPAPAQPGLLSSDPTKIIGVVNALNQNALFNKEFAARRAVGDAYSNALNPDGTVDMTKLSGGLKSPDAAFALPTVAPQVADLQGKNIQNVTSQLDQNRAQVLTAAGLYGAVANMENPTPNDIHKITATLAATTNIPAPALLQLSSTVLKDPLGVKHGAAMLQNMAIGPAGVATRTPTAPGPTGAPQTAPLGSVNLAGTIPTGLPPGEEALLGGGADRAGRLQATATTSPQYHSDLDNLKQDSRILENLGGPTADVEKKLNQLTQRVGGFGITMTADQLRAAESFDKIANQISLNQATLFHGSDASLHTVVGANPSTQMSRFGRDGVIDMLQGNQDAIDVTRKAWLDARAGKMKGPDGKPLPALAANQYDDFIHQFGQTLDPRVFQFNRLNRDNQQKFLSQMDPDDVADFEQKYRDAIARKWVKPLKATPNAQQ